MPVNGGTPIDFTLFSSQYLQSALHCQIASRLSPSPVRYSASLTITLFVIDFLFIIGLY